MPADLYREWMEFDAVEPLNPTGIIMRGLFGGKERPRSSSWQLQKQKFLQHIALFGKKKNGKP